MPIDLNDPKNANSIKHIMAEGQNSEFWRIINQVIDDYIKHIDNQRDSEDMRDLPSDEYKIVSEVIRHNRDYLLRLKEMPVIISEGVGENAENKKELDPYYSVKELMQQG